MTTKTILDMKLFSMNIPFLKFPTFNTVLEGVLAVINRGHMFDLKQKQRYNLLNTIKQLVSNIVLQAY